MPFFLPLLAPDRRGRRAWLFGVVVMIMTKLLRLGVVGEDMCPDPIVDAAKSIADTTIYERGSAQMQAAAGSSTVMSLDLDEATTSGEARAMLKFNTLLPPNAQLIRATLSLVATGRGSKKARAHRMLASWEENGVSWDIAAGEPWEKAVSFEVEGTKKFVSVDVTADVNAWHRGLAVNNGWILISNSTKERQFYTSEFRKRKQRPGLELEYCDVCPFLEEKILGADDDPSIQCRDFQASRCSPVNDGVQQRCPRSPFSRVLQFGRLNMAFTSSFEWRWDDKGIQGRDDAAFHHPFCPVGFFPLGSVAKSDYNEIDGVVAAMCFQDADNSGLLALPVGWTKVWDDRGSAANEDGSCWRAECPSGYVALGDVFVTGYSEPDLFDIACVRQDLTDSGLIGEVPVWTDRGDTGSMNLLQNNSFSAWQVESSLSDGSITVNGFVGVTSHDKPDDSLAINMRLPRNKGRLCPPDVEDCDPCKILKQELLVLTDARDKCLAFEEAGCSTLDLGNDELCPPPFPVASAEVAQTTPLCDIESSDPNNIPFDDVISITRGTDGRYYAIGEVEGMFKLIAMDIVVRIFTENNTTQCLLDVVQECTLPGKSIEAVAVADPAGGIALVFVAGQDKADGSPFISLVTPPASPDTEVCELVANGIDFDLPSDGENGNSTPFFHGLTTAPRSRDVLWSATQTSLYSPDQNKTSLGAFQYRLTSFQLGSGAVADREYLYFAETSVPKNESDTFVLKNNKLVDFVALDDYGSFLTMESGFLVEKGVPTMAPTEPQTPSPTTEALPSQCFQVKEISGPFEVEAVVRYDGLRYGLWQPIFHFANGGRDDVRFGQEGVSLNMTLEIFKDSVSYRVSAPPPLRWETATWRAGVESNGLMWIEKNGSRVAEEMGVVPADTFRVKFIASTAVSVPIRGAVLGLKMTGSIGDSTGGVDETKLLNDPKQIDGPFVLDAIVRFDNVIDDFFVGKRIFDAARLGEFFVRDTIWLGQCNNPTDMCLEVSRGDEESSMIRAEGAIEEGVAACWQAGVDADGKMWIDKDGDRLAEGTGVVPRDVNRSQRVGAPLLGSEVPELLQGFILGLTISNLNSVSLPPPEPIPSVEEEYVSTAGPRTCFYRAYVDVLFADVGVARKDLIECIAEEYTAVGTGVAEVLDRETSSRALRELRNEVVKIDSCTEDSKGKLLVVKKAEEAGRFAGFKIELVQEHLYTCRDCAFDLEEDVGGVFDGQRGSRENENVMDIERFAKQASESTESLKVKRKGVNSEACNAVIVNMDDLDKTLAKCQSGECELDFDLPDPWETRGNTINFCCAVYTNKFKKKKKKKKKKDKSKEKRDE